MSFNPGMGNGMSGPSCFSPCCWQYAARGGENAFPGMFDVTTQRWRLVLPLITHAVAGFGQPLGVATNSRSQSGMPRPPVERSMFDSPAFSGGTPRPTPRPFS